MDRHDVDRALASGTAQTAEMRAMFHEACETADKLRQIPRDQEIRARALECVTRLIGGRQIDTSPEEFDGAFWCKVTEFEDYIRNGK